MMRKEKQIEEMAQVISGQSVYSDEIAEALYKAGNRKQSEGKWQKHGNEKTCSLCKFIYYSNNDEWNFCPNCGAKMKGGAL